MKMFFIKIKVKSIISGMKMSKKTGENKCKIDFNRR
jgi:hypothetical protein